MTIAIYSICHFVVDGVCAFAMFHWFTAGNDGYLNILLYNFCAFALQMVLGTGLDYWNLYGKNSQNFGQKQHNCWYVAMLGMMLVLIGMFMNPVILGMGNALFHVGGGVSTLEIDFQKGYKGAGIGVFVAPGALGLFVGKTFSLNATVPIVVGISVAALLLCLCMSFCDKNCESPMNVVTSDEDTEKTGIYVVIGCVVVVILRSYIGMAIDFEWKNTLFMGLLAVIMVVLGKVSGGILASFFGQKKTVIMSLLMAMICYWFSEHAFFGLMALLFFNMTMPVTLYLLSKRYKSLPGFCFGLLTFGLFIGFLPVYFEWNLGMAFNMQGTVGCLVSLIILLVVI